MIRGLEPGDAPRLRALLGEFFRELDPRGSLFAEDAPAILTRIYLDAPPEKIAARVFVDEGELVGFLLGRFEDRPLRAERRILFLDAGYTSPGARGKGGMTALFREIRSLAKAANLTMMELATPVSNEEGLRFWTARGFQASMTGFTLAP